MSGNNLNGDAAQTTLPRLAMIDAAMIGRKLTEHYIDPRVARYVAFPELRTGTGYVRGSEQSIDLWVMDLWPSGDLRRIAFEIKISRSDFLRELKDPRKRKLALLWSNEFYFATPPNLVRVDELPPEAGLVEIRDEGGPYFKVAAPWRDTPAPSWRFLASVARRIHEGRVAS